MKRALFILIMSALILGAGAGFALAHGVKVYAVAEGDQLKGEAYFSGGGKAQGCLVELLDPAGKRLGQTRTDSKGAFSLPRPSAPAPLTLVLHAGQGHQAQYVLQAADLGAPPSPSPASAPAADPAPSGAAPPAPAQLAQALDQVLQKRLAPLHARLERLERESQAVGLKEVVGGLGWILGLLGIAAYFKSRRTPPAGD